jgi:hypothetical protein
MLLALQIQSFVSAYCFDIAPHSIYRMDTQLHYIIALKGEFYHKASMSRFQIKSICVSNPIRPYAFVMAPESIYFA